MPEKKVWGVGLRNSISSYRIKFGFPVSEILVIRMNYFFLKIDMTKKNWKMGKRKNNIKWPMSFFPSFKKNEPRGGNTSKTERKKSSQKTVLVLNMFLSFCVF